MNDAATSSPPRRRRGLGLLIDVVICATPLALPAVASAQTATDEQLEALPPGPNELLGGPPQTLTQPVQALPHTLSDPLGAPDAPGGGDACEDLTEIGPFLSCIIDRLDSLLAGQPAPRRQVDINDEVTASSSP